MRFCCTTKSPLDVIKFLEDNEDIPTSEISCVQASEDHSVLVTFYTDGPVDSLLEQNVVYMDRIPVIVTRADAPKWFVKVHYLPIEVSNDDVKGSLAPYGHIYNVRKDHYANHSDIYNGDRTVTMLVNKSIPSYLTIAGYRVKIWHPRQVWTCRKCDGIGHKVSECRETECYNCGRLGHMANGCAFEAFCKSCEETGHTAWKCPNRTKTFSYNVNHDGDETNQYPPLRSKAVNDQLVIPLSDDDGDEIEINEDNEAVNNQLKDADGEEFEEGEVRTEVMDEASVGERLSTCSSPSIGGTMDILIDNLDGNYSEDITESSDSQDNVDTGWTVAGRKRGANVVDFLKRPKR